MSKDEDRKVRSVFEKLRQEEERFVPEFHNILSGKESLHRAVGWGLWWRPAVVMLLFALMAGPVLYLSLRDSGNHELEISSELGGWESPTDFLLSFTDSSLDSNVLEIGTTLWEEDEISNLEN